ncbi:hypothetical protein ES705_27059 [subsurface metagenome]
MRNLRVELNLQHASLSDWDFFYVDTWEIYPTVQLDVDFFISEPCSLFTGHDREEVYAMPKWASMQNLKAGRITTWLRAQAAGAGSAYIYIGIRGIASRGIRLRPTQANNVWFRNRFTWWQGLNVLDEPATLVLHEVEDAGVWGVPALTYHDPMLPGMNRVGIGSTPQSSGYWRWWDNTIIEEWINEPCY